MGTVLATTVCLGFAWSTVLFFSALMRRRKQEDGFAWAVGGTVLFLVVFADRLPGHPTGVRDVLMVLPGVNAEDLAFTSSLLALGLLLVFYLFRIAVHYQLFLRDPDDFEEDGDEDRANDRVAPAMSYYCFAVCLVALLQPLYSLGIVATAGLCALLIGLYYWAILQRLLRSLRDLAGLARVAWGFLKLRLNKAILLGVVLISKADRFRHGDAPTALAEKLLRFEERLSRRRPEARADEKSLIAEAAQGE